MDTKLLKQLLKESEVEIIPRRPYVVAYADDDMPEGYLESDRDYVENNMNDIVWLLEGGLDEFADAIIRECIEAIRDRSMDSGDEWETGLELAQTAIIKHFKVT